MKKIILGAFIGLLVLVIGVGIVFANAPTISIDSIGTLSYATFPQIYNVTGTVTHSEILPPPGSAGDNVCALNAMKVLVDDGVNPTVTLLDQGNPAGYFGWSCSDTTANWNVDWSIPGPGTYTITAKIRHQSNEGIDTEEAIVTQLIVGQCPAAPSIAAHYLQELGIKSGSRTFKNIVSLVAQHMGPTTDFDGVTACESGYANVVMTFVDANQNVAK